MQPDAIAVLNGVKQVIFNVLMPELQSEQARQQAMLSSVLLDHLVARWEIEYPLLLEEYAELRALLTQAVQVCGHESDVGGQARTALMQSDTPSSNPRALDRDVERMRALVPSLVLRMADSPPQSEEGKELTTAIRSYIHSQHRRDQQLVQVGALGW